MRIEPTSSFDDVDRIERVIAALRAPDAYPYSLHEMAEIACLSPFHFARVFRRATGIPPGEFASALRLERAKRLLLTTDLSVTDICFEVGYSGLGAFVSRFTRLVGVSPGRFRLAPPLDLSTVAERGGNLTAQSFGQHNQTRITGRLEFLDRPVTPAFVGLFPSPIVQGQPVAGEVTGMASRFSFVSPHPGWFHLVAVAPFVSPPDAGPTQECSMPFTVARSHSAIGVGTDPRGHATILVMRPRQVIDPPIVTAFSVLFASNGPDEPGRPGKRNIEEAFALTAC